MANKSVKGYAELYDSPEDIGAVHCALYCQLYSDAPMDLLNFTISFIQKK